MIEQRFTVHGVLAAAYPGGSHSKPAVMLTHAVERDAAGGWLRVLCSRVQVDNLCDVEEAGAPTCAACAKHLAKLRGQS